MIDYVAGIDPSYISNKNAIVFLDKKGNIVKYDTLSKIKRNKVPEMIYDYNLYKEIQNYVSSNLELFTRSFIGIENIFLKFNVKTLLKLNRVQSFWLSSIFNIGYFKTGQVITVYPAQWHKYLTEHFSNDDLNSALSIAKYCLFSICK